MELDIDKATKIAQLYLDYLRNYNQLFFNHAEPELVSISTDQIKTLPDGWLFEVSSPDKLKQKIRFVCVSKNGSPFSPAPPVDVNKAETIEEIRLLGDEWVARFKQAGEQGLEI